MSTPTNDKEYTSPRNFERGDYEGDPAVEAAERTRRMEIRSNRFMRFMGYNPNPDRQREPERVAVIAKHGELYATCPSVTVGQIKEAALSARLDGDVDLYVGPHYWGKVRV